jgi:hypothetical protein
MKQLRHSDPRGIFISLRLTNLAPGVFVAGDGAGIAGVLVAKRQGTIAGLYAAAHAGSISEGQAQQAARAERKPLASMGKFRRPGRCR